MSYPYVGWVPCINGHLNFDLIKPGISGGFTDKKTKDDNTHCINFAYLGKKDHHARRVMIQSKVNWRDLLPENEYDGLFRVFLLAEASLNEDMDERCLIGSIYIYSISEYEENKKDNYTKPWFEQIHEAGSEYRNTKCKNWEIKKAFLNTKYEKLKEILNEQSFWRVDFHVNANGLVYLKTPTNEENELNSDEKYLITRQAYYYLKYSLHHHKHHQNEQDSLTTIVEYENTTDGKKSAALKLFCQLKRELTLIKRTLSGERELYSDDALGILGYMNSFLTSLFDSRMISNDIYTRERAYLDSLKSSFQAQDSRANNARNIKETIKSSYRIYIGWFIAVTSLFFAVIARPFFRDVPPELQFNFSISFVQFSIYFVALMVVIAIVYNFTVYRMTKVRLNEASLRDFIKKSYQSTLSTFIANFLKGNKWILALMLGLASISLVLYLLS